MSAERRVIVVGAGGHGRVVADLARTLGLTVVGYADADERRLGAVVDSAGAAVLLTQAELVACARGEREWPCGVDTVALGVGDNLARARLLAGLGTGAVATLVHPSAWVSGTATVGNGSVVLAGAVVNTDARLGNGTIVNSRATIEHDCVLEDGAHVSPGATLCGAVRVGAGSWIGAGAVIIPGRRVGAGCVVGAGAVVIRDVPDGATVAGNPARHITRSPRAPVGAVSTLEQYENESVPGSPS
ncbi:MAG TPA: acetyltransferase [Gemmatimonadales bacterium]